MLNIPQAVSPIQAYRLVFKNTFLDSGGLKAYKSGENSVSKIFTKFNTSYYIQYNNYLKLRLIQVLNSCQAM